MAHVVEIPIKPNMDSRSCVFREWVLKVCYPPQLYLSGGLIHRNCFLLFGWNYYIVIGINKVSSDPIKWEYSYSKMATEDQGTRGKRFCKYVPTQPFSLGQTLISYLFSQVQCIYVLLVLLVYCISASAWVLAWLRWANTSPIVRLRFPGAGETIGSLAGSLAAVLIERFRV